MFICAIGLQITSLSFGNRRKKSSHWRIVALICHSQKPDPRACHHVDLGTTSDSQRQQMWAGGGEESRARDGSSGQKPQRLEPLVTCVYYGLWRKKILHGITSLQGTSCHWPIVSRASHDFKISNHETESCRTVQQSGDSESCVVWPGHNSRQESQYFPKCPSIPLKEVTRRPWLLTQILTFPWWTICLITLLWGPWDFVKCHDVLCSRCDLLL